MIWRKNIFAHHHKQRWNNHAHCSSSAQGEQLQATTHDQAEKKSPIYLRALVGRHEVFFLHATLQSCNPYKFLEVKRSQNTNSWKWHMNAEHIYFNAILKTVGFEFSIEKQWLKNWFDFF